MTILCYHEVSPVWRSSLSVEPDVFAAHCRWLTRRRDVVPAEELARYVVNGSAPGRRVALTFDDGFQGVFTHALPVLERYRLPATVFVVARTLVDRRPVGWVDGPPPDSAVMDPDEIREAADRGLTVGSHSLAHHDLRHLTEAECVEDLKRSRQMLEDHIGRPVTTLAYPRGLHAPHVRRAAATAGYTWAFGLPERAEPVSAYSIPRVGVYPGNGLLGLGVKTARWYQPLRLGLAGPVARGGVRFVRRFF